MPAAASGRRAERGSNAQLRWRQTHTSVLQWRGSLPAAGPIQLKMRCGTAGHARSVNAEGLPLGKGLLENRARFRHETEANCWRVACMGITYVL